MRLAEPVKAFSTVETLPTRYDLLRTDVIADLEPVALARTFA
jgi:hypothetical protein